MTIILLLNRKCRYSNITTVHIKILPISIQEKKDVDYVHMFTKNFQQLAELDISKNELKVIARILNIMEFGNCFHISQAKLCRELDIKKSNMSLVFKKLKKKGIIIDKEGDLFMNSNIFLKGQAHSINAKQRPNVKKAQGFVVD